MNYLSTLPQIAIFKAKPQDIPYNVSYLFASFVGALLIAMFSASQTQKLSNPATYAAVQYIAFAVLFYLILVVNQKAERFVQSASAFFGIVALAQILTYLLIFVAKLGSFAILISLWSAVVQIYILRETLESSTLKAVALYACIQFSIIMILLSMFPELAEIVQASMQQPQA